MIIGFSSKMALVIAAGIFISGCRSAAVTNSVSHPAPAAAETKRPDLPPALDERSTIEAHAHYLTGVVSALDDDPATALNELSRAAQIDHKNMSLALEVSQGFIQLGQLDKAAEVLERVTNQPEASDELFARLGAIYFQLNRPAAALAASAMAIKKNPASPNAYPILFEIHLQNQQPKEALGVLDEAMKVANASPELNLLCGELYLRLTSQLADQREKIMSNASNAFTRVKIAPLDDPEMLLRLAAGFGAVNAYADAAAAYTKLLEDFPDLPFVRSNVRAKLADIFLRLNDRPHAADLLKLIIRDNPTDARAYYFLGNISFETTNFVQAVESYRRTLLLNPDFEPAYRELAASHLALNQAADAEAALAEGRKKFPRSFSLEYLSGIAASRGKNFTNAVQHFTTAEVIAKATDASTLQPLFYFQFGSACERTGEIAQAEQHFLKCLEMAPGFDEAQNYLGYMWAERGTNLDRARQLIEKALAAEPKNPAYLDSMAWVMFKLHQPKSALEFESKALANSEEEDAEIFHHLGDIHEALGDLSKAQEAWRKSDQLEPNENLRKKLGESK